MNEQLISAMRCLAGRCDELCKTTTRLANVVNSMEETMKVQMKHNDDKQEELMQMLGCLCKELHEYNANHKN